MVLCLEAIVALIFLYSSIVLAHVLPLKVV